MTTPVLSLLAGILGLFVGAFMNAKIFRSAESMAFTTRRSCAVCAVPVSHGEMLPIIGYMATKGRCRGCSAVVPWQYPVTELVVGILFALFAARALMGTQLPSFVSHDEILVLFVRDALVTCILTLVFMFDYRASVIPDRVTIPGMILVIILNLWLGMDVGMMLLGGLTLGGFFAIQYLLSQGRWVGGGDIRMGMFMGFLLGPLLGVIGLFTAYIFGALIGIVLLLSKRRELHSHVPFGTFLAFATFVAMFFGETLLLWYAGFFA